jgi:integrase
VRGHLRERSPGVWELIVDAGRDPLTGRRRQRSRTVRGTKRTAQRALAELVHEIGQQAPTVGDHTVGEALDRWLQQASGDLSPTTLREYRRLIERRVRPALGDIRVGKLTTAQIDSFYAALAQQAELAPATIRQVHSILRRGLRQAVRWQWIPANPAINATLPRIRRDEVSPPSPETIRLLLATAMDHDPTLGVLLITAAATGLRRGELCGLKWGDVDLARSRLVVTRSVAAVPSGTIEKSTKTHASRRLALDESTVRVLAEHHDRSTQPGQRRGRKTRRRTATSSADRQTAGRRCTQTT